HLIAWSKIVRQIDAIQIVDRQGSSLDLPCLLIAGYEMHDYASLQYYDTEVLFYVIGLEDPKENLGEIKRKQLKIDGYYDHLQRSAFEHIDSVRQIASARFTNPHGIRIQYGDFYTSGKNLAQMDLFYRICVCENEDYFYQLVIWMPFDTYCDRIDWIDLISSSLHFIGETNPPTISGG
ncbi:MAG: hypothetical protein AAFP02_11710, partial [Bacteroidota bacterium]